MFGLTHDQIVSAIGAVMLLALSAVGTLLLLVGGYIAKSLQEISKSIQELNLKIAVVISQQSSHEVRIKRLEDRT